MKHCRVSLADVVSFILVSHDSTVSVMEIIKAWNSQRKYLWYREKLKEDKISTLKTVVFQDHGKEEKKTMDGWWENLQEALLFLFCLEHVITVHRQRPELSSPRLPANSPSTKAWAVIHRKDWLGWTRLLASHLKAAEKKCRLGGCSHWGWEGRVGEGKMWEGRGEKAREIAGGWCFLAVDWI